jgi:hypothetical protein
VETSSRGRKAVLNQSEIVRRRLAAQFLTGLRAPSALEVLYSLVAVQAQEYLQAKWALALRTRDSVDADVEQLIDRGEILRTHALRPTWHFVSARDLRWVLALTGPRVHVANAHPYRRLELDASIFRKSHNAISRVLEGGKQLTRNQLKDVLLRVKIDLSETQRLPYILMHAELEGLICSGERQGKQSTYALLEERVPPVPAIERDEALLRLVSSYFTTRGPATVHDCAWWSGLTITEIKRGIDLAGTALEKVTSDSKTYWSAPSTRLPKSTATAHLLPIYDEYFIGLKDRSAIGQRLRDGKVVLGGDALFANIAFIDGQIVGGWKRTLQKSTVEIDFTPLVPLTAAEKKRLTAEAQRFGEFLGLRAVLKSS